eukprot:CAMPEP_0178957412 /NCGR_PEP_ID=MMETSP0789-20121207/10899_1 /TAXON_ID=3005 /ORGANISM="Rhizosolenia setigera, Strain CCMP 1694" /LENGTH=179 /DNA_ID=CAMNT_0020639657 /DNA_START=262 /DNA_END=798 /DNA_ORIENTATION=+
MTNNTSDIFLSTSASFVNDLFQRKIVSGDNTNHTSIELELELIYIIEAEPPISLFLSMQQQHEEGGEEEKLLAHNNNNTVNSNINISSFSSKQQKHDYMKMSNLLMSIKRNAMKLLAIYYSLSQKEYHHHHEDNSSSSLSFHLKPRVVKTCLQFLEMWNGFILAESRTTTSSSSSSSSS